MKRLVMIVLALATFAATPAVFACEKCIDKGSKDPNGGGPYNSAICWTADDGGWTYCIGGNTKCDGGSFGNSCPVSGGQCHEESPSDCVLNQTMSIRVPVTSHVTRPIKKCVADLTGACAVGVSAPVSFLR